MPDHLLATNVSQREGTLSTSDIPALRIELLEGFDDVFDTSGTLKEMVGQLMSIELRPDAVPFAVRNPHAIPLA